MKKRCIAGITAFSLALGTVTLPAANAAVAVFDAENVAKAIETVTNTLNILNTATSQLSIEVANHLGLNKTTTDIILQKQQNAKQDILSGDAVIDPEILAQSDKKAGILNRNSTPTSLLNQQIGMISDIYNKRISLDKIYEITQNHAKVMEATQKDAVTMAQNIQTSDEKISSSVNDAITAAYNAEGHMQVMQSNATINAAGVQSIQNGNQLLAQILAAETVDSYVKNYEKAIQAQMLANSQKELNEWVSGF